MSFGGILKGALPWIGAAVTGGPVGIAAMALKTIGDKLGVKAPKNAAEAEALYVNATPEQRLALKQEDDNFAIRMKELGIQEVEDLEKIAADDRASARSREIQVRDKTPTVLACVVTIGFFGLLALVCFHEPPSGMKDILLAMIGTLGTAWVSVISYYFGSSSGSRAKDDTIAGLSAK
jgi:hypothetical protein